LLRRLGNLLSAVFHVERRTLPQLLMDRLRPHRATRYYSGAHGRARRVYDAYRWARYEGPVTFFRATRRIPVLTHQLYAWRRVAPHLTVVDTPGMHYDMVDREHAGALARAVTEALPAGGVAR
jgi:acetoacetyl-CoA synthetase